MHCFIGIHVAKEIEKKQSNKNIDFSKIYYKIKNLLEDLN